jgi:hypothetical protein
VAGYGAAQWTDYAPPASWAGYGQDPFITSTDVRGMFNATLYGIMLIGGIWAWRRFVWGKKRK